MALESYSDIAAALGTSYERDLFHQFNRNAETLGVIRAAPAVNKVPAWDVEFTAGTAPGAYTEGADYAAGDFTTDTPQAATLGWGLYRTGFQLSQTEIQAALASNGSPDALTEILGDRMLTKAARLASTINSELFVGTGAGGNTMVGLYGGALDATGTYAALARGTYSEWAGNVLSNGGVPRPLTVDLLAQAEELIYRSSGRSFDFMVGSTGVRRKYQGLFEANRRVITPGTEPVAYGAGTTGSYTYAGVEVRRDKDASSGKLIMGVLDYLLIRFLPPLGASRDTTVARMAMLQGSNGNPAQRITATAIPYQIVPLAKTGNNVKFGLDVTLQLEVFRPNAFCIISDIAET